MGIVILLPLFLLMYFMMIRPQQKAKAQHAEMLRNLSVGDQVVTAGGIFGNVVQVEDDVIWVEVAPDTELKIARGAITRKLPPAAGDVEDYEGPDTSADYTEPDVDSGTTPSPVEKNNDD
ncbi:MAG: preprotein translocase subunit YajC [Acidimicrobiia bacterium]